VLPILLFCIVACQRGKHSRPLNEKVGSFVRQSTSVVTFGSIKIDKLLTLSEYEENFFVKSLIRGSLDPFRNALQLDSPVYYASEQLLWTAEQENVANYLFIEVKDRDSLRELLVKKGFRPSDTPSFSYIQNEQIHLAFDAYMVVVLVQKNSDSVQKIFRHVFEATRKRTDDHTQPIFNTTDDFLAGVHLANLYATNHAFLASETRQAQEGLQALLKNSFLEISFDFAPGEMAVELRHHFSDSLRRYLFFEPPSFPEVLQDSGCSTPSMGLSASIDTRKVHDFLDEYLPQNTKIWGDKLALPFSVLDVLSVLDGRMTLIACEPKLTDIQGFIGVTKRGKILVSLMNTPLKRIFGELLPLENGLLLRAKSQSASTHNNTTIGGKLGKHSIDFFIDLSRFENVFEHTDDTKKHWDIVQSIDMYYGTKGGRIVVHTKNTYDNVLKQLLEYSLRSIF